MNKKLFFTTLVATSVVLTSCGAPKELGTFTDEMKTEQQSYVKSIANYMDIAQEYSQGKMKQDGDFTLKVELPTVAHIDLKGDINMDVVLEDTSLAAQSDLELDLKAKVEKGVDDAMYSQYADTNGEAHAKVRFGLLSDSMYVNVKELSFDGTGNEEIQAMVKQAKTQFNFAKTMFVAKWFSFAFPEEFKTELQKALANNKKIMMMFQEGLGLMLTGDIFTEAEKTTYEGQTAYKFSIDEEKTAKHMLTVMKTLEEKYADVFEAQGLDKEAFAENVKQFEAMVNAPDAFKEKRFISELYMTRAKDGGINIYMPVFRPVDKPESENLSISIVENTTTIDFHDDTNKLTAKIVGEGNGKMSFSGGLFEGKTQIATFTGSYGMNVKGSSIDEKIDVSVKVAPQNKDAYNPVEKYGMNIMFTSHSNSKKDSGVKITKESITNNAKDGEITNLEELMKSFGAPMPMYGGTTDTDEIDLDEYSDDIEEDGELDEVEVEEEDESNNAEVDSEQPVEENTEEVKNNTETVENISQ